MSRFCLIAVTFAFLSCQAPSAQAQRQPQAPAGQHKYTFEMPKNLSVGSRAEIELPFSIRADDGFVIKVETPFEANFTASKGITLTKTTLKNVDVKYNEQKELSGSTLLSATTEGSVTSQFKFFVCDESQCARFEESLTTKILVTDQ